MRLLNVVLCRAAPLHLAAALSHHYLSPYAAAATVQGAISSFFFHPMP